jgi:hypothetical protein
VDEQQLVGVPDEVRHRRVDGAERAADVVTREQRKARREPVAPGAGADVAQVVCVRSQRALDPRPAHGGVAAVKVRAAPGEALARVLSLDGSFVDAHVGLRGRAAANVRDLHEGHASSVVAEEKYKVLP